MCRLRSTEFNNQFCNWIWRKTTQRHSSFYWFVCFVCTFVAQTNLEFMFECWMFLIYYKISGTFATNMKPVRTIWKYRKTTNLLGGSRKFWFNDQKTIAENRTPKIITHIYLIRKCRQQLCNFGFFCCCVVAVCYIFCLFCFV